MRIHATFELSWKLTNKKVVSVGRNCPSVDLLATCYVETEMGSQNSFLVCNLNNHIQIYLVYYLLPVILHQFICWVHLFCLLLNFVLVHRLFSPSGLVITMFSVVPEKQREFYKNAKCVSKYKKSLKQLPESENHTSPAAQFPEV